MQKPVISNRYLNKKWNDKENDLYLRKIWLAKPSNSIQSSVKAKSLIPKLKPKHKEHYVNIKQFEIERDNKTLLEKISNISSKSNMSKSHLKSEKFLPKTINIFKPKGVNRKMEILKITQENQALLKRLQESNSYYDRNKWEQDFMKNVKYKLQICEFPHVEHYLTKNPTQLEQYYHTRTAFRPNTQPNEKKFNLTGLSFNKNKTFNSTFGGKMGFSKTYEFRTNSLDQRVSTNDSEKINSNINILFTKITKMKGIGLCQIDVYIENKKFVICALDDSQKRYFLYIEKIDEIMKMQSVYKNYDQMIGDLEFKDGLLRFSGDLGIDLDYISLNDKNQDLPPIHTI